MQRSCRDVSQGPDFVEGLKKLQVHVLVQSSSAMSRQGLASDLVAFVELKMMTSSSNYRFRFPLHW